MNIRQITAARMIDRLGRMSNSVLLLAYAKDWRDYPLNMGSVERLWFEHMQAEILRRMEFGNKHHASEHVRPNKPKMYAAADIYGTSETVSNG